MRRVILGGATGLVTATASAPAMAFCGLWDSPAALGFDAGAWGEKWPVLLSILVLVLFFTGLALRFRARMCSAGMDA